jgi:hypothetical protein
MTPLEFQADVEPGVVQYSDGRICIQVWTGSKDPRVSFHTIDRVHGPTPVSLYFSEICDFIADARDRVEQDLSLALK